MLPSRPCVIIGQDTFFTSQTTQFAALAEHRDFALARAHLGAELLISYGASLPNAYRQTGMYTGRILKGEKPPDLSSLHAALHSQLNMLVDAVRRAYRSDLTAVSCSFGLRTAKQDAPSC